MEGRAHTPDGVSPASTGAGDVPATSPPPPHRPVSNRADRFKVVLHVERPMPGAAPDGEAGRNQAVLASSGHGVPAETWRRLACDGSLVEMVHDADGKVLDVGRKRGTIPPAIRRALDHRDRTCRFPGCESRYCDAHHMRHWADGGATELDNLIKLCRVHHQPVHEGGVSIELREDGDVRFRGPGGWPIADAPAPPALRGDGAAALRAANEQAGLVIDPWTPMPDWHGESLDLDWAMYVMWRPRRRDEGGGEAPGGRDAA